MQLVWRVVWSTSVVHGVPQPRLRGTVMAGKNINRNADYTEAARQQQVGHQKDSSFISLDQRAAGLPELCMNGYNAAKGEPPGNAAPVTDMLVGAKALFDPHAEKDCKDGGDFVKSVSLEGAADDDQKKIKFKDAILAHVRKKAVLTKMIQLCKDRVPEVIKKKAEDKRAGLTTQWDDAKKDTACAEGGDALKELLTDEIMAKEEPRRIEALDAKLGALMEGGTNAGPDHTAHCKTEFAKLIKDKGDAAKKKGDFDTEDKIKTKCETILKTKAITDEKNVDQGKKLVTDEVTKALEINSTVVNVSTPAPSSTPCC